jgi:hypothetical protein
MVDVQGGDTPEIETWQNVGKGSVTLVKVDQFGRESRETVTGGRRFSITTAERELNSDRAASSAQDWFQNGALVLVSPVKILDGNEDVASATKTANRLTNADIEGMLAGHWKTFEKQVNEITNTLTLQRFLDIAYEKDASVKKVELVENRIKEIDPQYMIGGSRQIVGDLGGERDVEGFRKPKAVGLS